MTEKIQIDLEATDDASDVIDDVASAAEALEELAPEIPVTADTSSAESDLSDVESRADDVARLSPEIPVTADTSAATGDLESIESKADALSAADAEIVLTAQVSSAKRALTDLRGDLETTEGKADATRRAVDDVGSDGGQLPAGNAIADLAGPLGDAEGAASTAAGALEGFSEIAGGIAGKLGASASTITGMTTALGGVGLAVAAGAAAYTYFSGKAEAAKQKQEELNAAVRDYNDALEEGDWTAAADQLAGMFEDAFTAADKANLPMEEFVNYLQGATDELPSFARNMDGAKAAIDEAGNSMGALGDRHFEQTWEGYRDTIESARAKLATTNGILVTQKQRTDQVAAALQSNTTKTRAATRANDAHTTSIEEIEEALDNMKAALSFDQALNKFNQDFRDAFRKVRDGRRLTTDDIFTLKDNVLNVAEFADMHPAQVRALLRRIERGDIAGVRDAVQLYMDQHTVETPAGVKLIPGSAAEAHADAQDELNQFNPIQIPTEYAGPTSTPPWMRAGAGAATSEIVNVTMNLPRGYRELDVIAAGRRAARRHGGLYRRVRR